MATNGASPPNVQRNLKGFTTDLKSAACECNHRLEISSLISCNIHGKLVDGHGMCEHCLTSHGEENKSNSHMQRIILGKSEFDPAGFGNRSSQSSFFNKDLTPASKCTRLCICCNKPWIARPNGQRLLPQKSHGIAVAKPNIPSPRRLSSRNGSKKIRHKFSAPAASHIFGKTGFDSLSPVGDTQLKITSESESEVPFSDDEDGLESWDRSSVNEIYLKTHKNKWL